MMRKYLWQSASASGWHWGKSGWRLQSCQSGKGNSIELNSNYVAEQVIDLTDWQYEYGQGANNMKPTTQLVAYQSGQSSWGGKLDEISQIQFTVNMYRPLRSANKLKTYYLCRKTLQIHWHLIKVLPEAQSVSPQVTFLINQLFLIQGSTGKLLT